MRYFFLIFAFAKNWLKHLQIVEILFPEIHFQLLFPANTHKRTRSRRRLGNKQSGNNRNNKSRKIEKISESRSQISAKYLQ